MMNRPQFRGVGPHKTVFTISVVALSVSVLLSTLSPWMSGLSEYGMLVFAALMYVLMLGAISGPIAQHFIYRKKTRTYSSSAESHSRKFRLASWGTRITAILIAAALGYVGMHGLLYVQMLRAMPFQDDVEPLFAARLYLGFALLGNFASWLFVRSIMNALDPKPLTRMRRLRVDRRTPENLTSSSSSVHSSN